MILSLVFLVLTPLALISLIKKQPHLNPPKSSSSNSLKAHIKKIMQADEDIGKIALAVPVLVSEQL
ncbi:hypothetical protein J1N35_025129 [Gossypium stocksii]|uniref:Transcription factor CBF/NF-Y/archaeal histone domain-containing protein n=1 Tax=Gossypium stocksii TaxID=47602 RepID=A0A9D3V6W2_9ROSI|nr:hypothetical protein J1N35_025129 [Gossypium stocksii]